MTLKSNAKVRGFIENSKILGEIFNLTIEVRGARCEERLRERLRVGASAGMGELARVIDEVASLVEEWRLGEAVSNHKNNGTQSSPAIF